MAKNKNKAKPKAPRYNMEMAEEPATKLLKNSETLSNTTNRSNNK